MPLVGADEGSAMSVEWLSEQRTAAAAGVALVASATNTSADTLRRRALWVLEGERAVLPRTSSRDPLPEFLGTVDATTCVMLFVSTAHAVGCAHLNGAEAAAEAGSVVADVCRVTALLGGDASAADVVLVGGFRQAEEDGGEGPSHEVLGPCLEALHSVAGCRLTVRAAAVLGGNTRGRPADDGGWGAAPGFPLCTAAAIRVRATEAPAGPADGDAAPTAGKRAPAGSPAADVVCWRSVLGLAGDDVPMRAERSCRSSSLPRTDAAYFDTEACSVVEPAADAELVPVTVVSAAEGGDDGAAVTWRAAVLPSVPSEDALGGASVSAVRALPVGRLLAMSTSPAHEPPHFASHLKAGLVFAAGGPAAGAAAFGRPGRPVCLRSEAAGGAGVIALVRVRA